MLKIVHVIERFASTGPERAIIAAAKGAARAGLAQQRIVCTLEAAASPIALAQARQAGLQVLRNPDPATRWACLAAADIVQLHYWNNPAMQAFLRSELPPMRLLVYTDIFGSAAPQVIPPELLAFADVVVVASPGTLQLPQLLTAKAGTGNAPHTRCIFAPADFDRLAGVAPQPHPGFQVGYVGVVNFAKLHPAFVALCARVRVPAVQFIVCGAGGEELLAEQARALGAQDRFQFRGYVENIRAAFAQFDLFGYPLRPDTYAASELVLQEAMWAGVPPVVFPHGGVGYMVEHGVTGLVVREEADYAAAIERLYAEPALRAQLGANARDFALETFDPLKNANAFAAIYAELMQQPKRTRGWPTVGSTAAEWFVAALGDQGAAFAASLAAGAAAAAAEDEIAAASDLLFSGEGGLVHFRNHFPADPHLHRWVGLVLARRGAAEQAAREFAAAAELAAHSAATACNAE